MYMVILCRTTAPVGKCGGFSESYFQILVPHDVDFLFCINDKIPNLIQQFIFVHVLTMDNVSGFYYNATDYSGKLSPCPEPPSGARHVTHRDQMWFTLCDEVNILKHSNEQVIMIIGTINTVGRHMVICMAHIFYI